MDDNLTMQHFVEQANRSRMLQSKLVCADRNYVHRLNQIKNCLDEFANRPIANTGFWAGFARRGAKWECVGIWHEDDDEDGMAEAMEESAVIMPIPEPESLPEFDGF